MTTMARSYITPYMREYRAGKRRGRKQFLEVVTLARAEHETRCGCVAECPLGAALSRVAS